jgi:hypothetical protein
MTFKDLQRMMQQQEHQLEENNPEIERLKTLVYQKQFYQSNEKVHEIRYREHERIMLLLAYYWSNPEKTAMTCHYYLTRDYCTGLYKSITHMN